MAGLMDDLNELGKQALRIFDFDFILNELLIQVLTFMKALEMKIILY